MPEPREDRASSVRNAVGKLARVRHGRRLSTKRDARASPGPDELLDWQPIREVPAHFAPAVTRAQHALARYLADRHGDDLDTAQREWDEIVQDAGFSATPIAFRVDLLNRSAVARQWRGVRDGTTRELKQALQALDRALALSDTNSERALLMHNAGMTYLLAFQLAGDSEDLEMAVASLREAVEAAGGDPRNGPLALSGMAAVLSARFRIAGDIADIDEAVELSAKAITLASGESPRRRRYRDILSEALAYRFDAVGNLDDLDRAIDLMEQPLSGPDVEARGTLATLLRRRWVVAGEPEDLNRSIELLREEARSDEPGPRPARLTNLGNALLNRFELVGEVADLREAVDAHERSVRATPEGDWQLASRFNNAGNSALALHEVTGQPEALQRAVDHYERAVALTPPLAQEYASRVYNLGNARRTVFDRSGSSEVADSAVASYRQACEAGLATSLQWALAASEAWASWAVNRASWAEAVEASNYGLDAIDRLFRRQLGREEKQRWLARAGRIPALCAAACARAGSLPAGALALERGRAFLLSEVLDRDRTDLSRLRSVGRSDLADRYQAASLVLSRADAG